MNTRLVLKNRFDPSLELRAVLAIPVVSLVLAVVLLLQMMIYWANNSHNLTTRLHNSLILFAMAVFVYFLNTWNLLGWRF